MITLKVSNNMSRINRTNFVYKVTNSLDLNQNNVNG